MLGFAVVTHARMVAAMGPLSWILSDLLLVYASFVRGNVVGLRPPLFCVPILMFWTADWSRMAVWISTSGLGSYSASPTPYFLLELQSSTGDFALLLSKVLN